MNEKEMTKCIVRFEYSDGRFGVRSIRRFGSSYITPTPVKMEYFSSSKFIGYQEDVFDSETEQIPSLFCEYESKDVFAIDNMVAQCFADFKNSLILVHREMECDNPELGCYYICIAHSSMELIQVIDIVDPEQEDGSEKYVCKCISYFFKQNKMVTTIEKIENYIFDDGYLKIKDEDGMRITDMINNTRTKISNIVEKNTDVRNYLKTLNKD